MNKVIGETLETIVALLIITISVAAIGVYKVGKYMREAERGGKI